RADGVTGVPGHGPDVEDTGRFARELGRHRRDRLEQIIAARAELGADADAAAITQHIYRDVSPFLLTVAEQSTAVALKYLDRRRGRSPPRRSPPAGMVVRTAVIRRCARSGHDLLRGGDDQTAPGRRGTRRSAKRGEVSAGSGDRSAQRGAVSGRGGP